jgi:hypothetical protein
MPGGLLQGGPHVCAAAHLRVPSLQAALLVRVGPLKQGACEGRAATDLGHHLRTADTRQSRWIEA